MMKSLQLSRIRKTSRGTLRMSRNTIFACSLMLGSIFGCSHEPVPEMPAAVVSAERAAPERRAERIAHVDRETLDILREEEISRAILEFAADNNREGFSDFVYTLSRDDTALLSEMQADNIVNSNFFSILRLSYHERAFERGVQLAAESIIAFQSDRAASVLNDAFAHLEQIEAIELPDDMKRFSGHSRYSLVIDAIMQQYRVRGINTEANEVEGLFGREVERIVSDASGDSFSGR